MFNYYHHVSDSFEITHWYIITRAVVNIIPAWTRFWQCLRRYRDSKEAFPHLVNAGKYSTTFFVVMFATLRTLYNGKYLTYLEGVAADAFYFIYIVGTS